MMTAGILHAENPAQENLVCNRPVEVSGQIFSDQTGRFPIVSSRGNRSVMVLYNYVSNAILTGPLKNNITPELVIAQTRLTQYLLYRGFNPTAFRIDNESPEALKLSFRSNSIDFQLFPPNNHRTNQAEKAINTCKCHFLAGLSGVDPNFPLHLWGPLLPQVTKILNLLRISWINP